MADKTINGLDPIGEVTLETEIPMWDEVNGETRKGTVQELKDVIAEGVSAGVAYKGTRAGYETAKLIPAGEEGFIPDSSLVIITDENRTYVTSGTGAEQTISLVARVMSAGDGISISNSDAIKADTVTFTGTRAEWEALSTAQKAKFNIVNITDEMECAYQDIYSETEVKTNKVWIDGKPIYRKVVTFTISNNQTQNHAHGIANLGSVVNVTGFATKPNEYTRSLNFVYYGTLDYSSAFSINNQNIYLEMGSAYLANYNGQSARVILEYTKTTDV